MTEPNNSKMVKADAAMSCFDVKQICSGKTYLVITASRRQGKTGKRERARMAAFPEHAQENLTVTQMMIAKLEEWEWAA